MANLIRKNNSVLKNLVSLLREADEVKKESGEDSLDSQIDKYFSDYEAEAKNSKNEGLSFRSLTQRLLSEEDEEENTEEDTGDETPTDDSVEERLTTDDIDIKSFTADVMRLIDNYDSLLEIRNTILRRASNFLGKSYDESTIEMFKEELMETHGVEIGKSEADMEDEFEAPKAGAAGPMSGGGTAA